MALDEGFELVFGILHAFVAEDLALSCFWDFEDGRLGQPVFVESVPLDADRLAARFADLPFCLLLVETIDAISHVEQPETLIGEHERQEFAGISQ